MNYLTHYYLNRAKLDPLFHYGVALPDILSFQNRHLRFKMADCQAMRDRTRFPMLWEGVIDHLRVDARFHTSREFQALYSEIHRGLTQLLPDVPYRLFFVAHVLIEIVFDHILLKRHPSLAREFYGHLHLAVDQPGILNELETFFQKPLDGFDRHVDRFMTIRFLEYYIHDEHLTVPLNRMLERTGQPQATEHQARSVIGFVRSRMNMLEKGLEQCLPK